MVHGEVGSGDAVIVGCCNMGGFRNYSRGTLLGSTLEGNPTILGGAYSLGNPKIGVIYPDYYNSKVYEP